MILAMTERECAVTGLSEDVHIVDSAEDHIAWHAVGALNVSAFPPEIGVIAFAYRGSTCNQKLSADNFADRHSFREIGFPTNAIYDGRNGSWSLPEITNLDSPWAGVLSSFRSV